MFEDCTMFQSLYYTAVEQRNSYTVTFYDNDAERKCGDVEKYIKVYTMCVGSCLGNCLCEPQYFAVIKELGRLLVMLMLLFKIV